MASLTEQIADALALEVIRAAEELGDEDLVTQVSREIGAASTTTQEALLTAVRVRMSEKRARALLAERLGRPDLLAFARVGGAAVPPAPADEAPDQRVAEPQPRVGANRKPPSPEKPSAAPQATAAEPGNERETEPLFDAASSAEAPDDHALQAAPNMSTGIRPRTPQLPKGPVVANAPAPSPDALAAALALASTLPRKAPPLAESSPPIPRLDPDIEIPDGDWG